MIVTCDKEKEHGIVISKSASTLYMDVEGGSEGSDDGNYDAVIPERSPAVLSWENLTITAKAKQKGGETKILLNNLTGTVTGGVWAIMGSSGSGANIDFVIGNILIF